MLRALRKMFTGREKETSPIPMQKSRTDFTTQIVYATDIFNHILVYEQKVLDEDVISVEHLESVCEEVSENPSLNYNIYSQTQIIVMIQSTQNISEVLTSLTQFGNFVVISYTNEPNHYLFINGSLYDYKQFLKNIDAGSQISIALKNTFYSNFYSCYFTDLIQLGVVEDLFLVPGADIPELTTTITMANTINEDALNESITKRMENEYLNPIYIERDNGDIILDIPNIEEIAKKLQSISVSEIMIFNIIQNLFHVNVIRGVFTKIERLSFKRILNDMEEETYNIRYYLLYQYDNGSLGNILQVDEHNKVVLALQAPDCNVDEIISVTTIEEEVDPGTGFNIETESISYEGMQTGGMELFDFDPDRYQSTRLTEDQIKEEKSGKYDL